MTTLLLAMTKKTAIGLSVAMMLVGFAVMVFELFLAATLRVSFVLGGAIIVGLMGYLLIEELGRT